MKFKDLQPDELRLIETLSTLDLRQREILTQSFVLHRTLEETSKLYKISRQRILQIQEDGIKKIRKSLQPNVTSTNGIQSSEGEISPEHPEGRE